MTFTGSITTIIIEIIITKNINIKIHTNYDLANNTNNNNITIKDIYDNDVGNGKKLLLISIMSNIKVKQNIK